jgi:crossover junction endodeoxyribonuclease RuvC
MCQNTHRILAIDPGTRNLGYALLAGDDLLYQGVKVIKKQSSPHETLNACRKTVLSLIKHLNPTVLALEKTFIGQTRRTALLNVFGDEIKAIARRKELTLVAYAPSTIKKLISGNGWADKREVANAVLLHYPELKPYLGSDRQWKTLYHANMFDAVALAIVARDNMK